MKDSHFKNIVVTENSENSRTYGYVKAGGVIKCVLFGKKRIRRTREILNIMYVKNVDFKKLDDRFFSVLSLYLCEEKNLNMELLNEEIRRLS
jgi:hypothetical protein